MIILLMLPQLLQTTEALALIIGAPKPGTVMLLSKMNRVPMTLQITNTSERFGATGWPETVVLLVAEHALDVRLNIWSRLHGCHCLNVSLVMAV